MMVRPNGPAEIWQMLVLANSSDDLILAACQEAEKHSFFPKLAQYLIASEEAVLGRNPAEVQALVQANPGLIGQGITQALMNDKRGFMNAKILPKVASASEACARVIRKNPHEKPLGTAFLVKPNIVMTAAHVVLKKDEDQGEWRTELLDDLAFEFETDTTPSGKLTISPKSQNALLSHAKPHASVDGTLILGHNPPANENLDFAFVLLDKPVPDVPIIHIDDRATVKENKACWAFGHPLGAELVFDVDSVILKNENSGRWQHKANTGPGMSGGVCINHLGQFAGIHEGTVELNAGIKYNRGISIAAIRKLQHENGEDPLDKLNLGSPTEFHDAALVTKLYKAGKKLAPRYYVSGWINTVEEILEVIPDGYSQTTSFHPWFKRGQFENWIDNDKDQNRLAFVYGDRGTGKSFCTEILRAKLDLQPIDLVALDETKTRSIASTDQWAKAIDAQDRFYRTDAASIKYSDSSLIIRDLEKKWTKTKRKRYVVLDFGHTRDSEHFENSPWFGLVKDLLAYGWVRIVLIGLNQNERNTLVHSLFYDYRTKSIEAEECAMTHISRNEFFRFATNLATSRGEPDDPVTIEEQVERTFADYLGTEKINLQTCGAALAGIQLGIADET